jgi:sugar phosphate isomerase/epimerase
MPEDGFNRFNHSNPGTITNMLAISTAWNGKKHESGRAVIKELLALGFQNFEINVHFSEAMLLEIEPLIHEDVIRISSLHNFCPVPPGTERTKGSGDIYKPSALNEEERKQAVEHTKRTLDWAARLGAGAIVAHWGEVDMPNPQREWVKRLLQSDPNVQSEIQHAWEERERLKQPYLEQTLRSLQEIGEYAHALGIQVGVETRYYFHQFPSLEEVEMFLNVAPDTYGYWHDNGHAQTQQFIGIARQSDYLARYGDRLMGAHLMDIINGDRDHQAFGRGEFPIEQYASALTQAQWQVMEIHHATPEELIASRERLERCGFGDIRKT